MAFILPKACHSALESQWNTPTKWCDVCQPDCIPTTQPDGVVSVDQTASPHPKQMVSQLDCLLTPKQNTVNQTISPPQLNAVCQTNCFPPPQPIAVNQPVSSHPNQMLSTRLSPTPQSNGACQADYLPTPNQMLSTKLFPYTPAKRCQLDCLPHPNQLVSVNHTVFPYPSQMLSTRISPYNPIKCCLSIRLLPHPGHFKHYMQSSPSWTESCNDSWYSFIITVFMPSLPNPFLHPYSTWPKMGIIYFSVGSFCRINNSRAPEAWSEIKSKVHNLYIHCGDQCGRSSGRRKSILFEIQLCCSWADTQGHFILL